MYKLQYGFTGCNIDRIGLGFRRDQLWNGGFERQGVVSAIDHREQVG